MSVVAAALVPAAPVLVRGMGGRLAPADEPRMAALAVIRSVVDAAPDEIAIVGEGDTDEEFDGSTPSGMRRVGDPGIPRGAARPARVLPVSLSVGSALLAEAGWTGPIAVRSVRRDMPAPEAVVLGRQLGASARRTGLLLLGSGSARSTAKAPGSLHPEAQAFNSALVDMISAGDREAMVGLMQERAEEQMSDVRIALAVLAGAAPGIDLRGEVAFAQDFAGVFYVCAAFAGR